MNINKRGSFQDQLPHQNTTTIRIRRQVDASSSKTNAKMELYHERNTSTEQIPSFRRMHTANSLAEKLLARQAESAFGVTQWILKSENTSPAS